VSLNRYAKQRDANEPEIIARLENDGYSVWQIDVPCDLLVGQWGRTHLVEVKNPDGRGTRLTRQQRIFHARWKGCIHTGTTGEDILLMIQQCQEVPSA
jgi:hypothetical protein